MEELEKLLLGQSTGDAMSATVRDFFSREDIQAFGVTPEAVLKVLQDIGKEAAEGTDNSKEVTQ